MSRREMKTEAGDVVIIKPSAMKPKILMVVNDGKPGFGGQATAVFTPAEVRRLIKILEEIEVRDDK